MTIRLLVTDRNLALVGDPIDGWTNLECTRRFNEPASGSVELPAWPEVIAQLQPGNRLVVLRDGDVWCAGPMEVPQDYAWGIGDSSEPDPGKVTVSFSDDLSRLAGYLTWPTPASVWADQPATSSREIAHTNGETIIRTLVNENCGPGAITARRLPNLVVDTVAGIGSSVSITTRFEALLDACRRVAIWGGGLGFRTWQAGSQVHFGCYAPTDKTRTARFSRGLGNLQSVRFQFSAPTATHALVAGSDGTTPRAFVEVADAAAAASWWRVERYVDGSVESDATGELTASGNEELAGGAAPVELATVTVDTEDLKAGRDYDLGDRVAIELPTGIEVVDVVRSIQLQASPDAGEVVSALVGSPEATSNPAMVRIVRELGRRLGRIEAR